MYAGEDYLLGITLQRGLNIGKDLRDRATVAASARNCRNTKSAMVIAAVLYFDEGACSVVKAGHPLAGDWLQVEGFLWKIQIICNKPVFAIISDHLRDGGQAGSLPRLNGDPTAGRNYLFHPGAGDLADLPARVGGCFRRDRTSIDHSQVGAFCVRNDLMSGSTELPGYVLDFRLI